jgi:hypothetical protein
MPSLSYYLEKIPGDAPPEIRAQMIADAKRKVRDDVFGVGHRVDKLGKPIEQGLGSRGNMTATSVAAYEKHCSHESNFSENLARMKRELAECEARRAAQGAL